MQKSRELSKIERRGNEYTFDTFNTKMQQEDCGRLSEEVGPIIFTSTFSQIEIGAPSFQSPRTPVLGFFSLYYVVFFFTISLRVGFCRPNFWCPLNSLFLCRSLYMS